MPPALRRAFSSPSVRATPYQSALSNLNAGSGRVRGHENRRSSGSRTSRRRVLADLEWWRVVDGQHEDDVEQVDAEEGERDQTGEPPAVDDASVEIPSTPLVWVFESSPEVEVIPTRQLAALSIAPSTPRRLSRRRTHTFQSPPSSLESTPEADESIRFSPFDSDVRFSDTPELPRFSLALPLPPLPLPVRGHSFDFSALLNESANRFGDIGVPSRRLDIFN